MPEQIRLCRINPRKVQTQPFCKVLEFGLRSVRIECCWLPVPRMNRTLGFALACLMLSLDAGCWMSCLSSFACPQFVCLTPRTPAMNPEMHPDSKPPTGSGRCQPVTSLYDKRIGDKRIGDKRIGDKRIGDKHVGRWFHTEILPRQHDALAMSHALS